jgi:uncharacterized membrane protein YtjA (UPF0391 family)
MLGWAIGFFLAALVAAVFGFGGIASAFTGIAIILFWVFVALFVLSLVFGSLGRGHAAGHAITGHGTGRTVGLLALVAGVAVLVYAWVDNDMSAERVGAQIDRTAVEVAEGTSDALSEGADRAGDLVDDTSDEIRNDASQGLDEASDNVDPDNNPNN